MHFLHVHIMCSVRISLADSTKPKKKLEKRCSLWQGMFYFHDMFIEIIRSRSPQSGGITDSNVNMTSELKAGT